MPPRVSVLSASVFRAGRRGFSPDAAFLCTRPAPLWARQYGPWNGVGVDKARLFSQLSPRRGDERAAPHECDDPKEVTTKGMYGS